MIANLTLYPAYEHSGVEWLGSVPQHWDVRRLATSVYGCVNGTWGRDPNGREDLPCIRVADFDRVRLRVGLSKPTFRAIASRERNHRLLKNGDLLIEKSGGGDLQPVGAVMLYDHDTEAVCSNFVARMPVARHCDAGYLTYLHSHLYAIRLNVRSIKQTTGIQNLDSSSYLGETVAFPPLAEQVAIVRYLGHADRRIRRYIRAKERLIELLEEQKQAIIHQAVTGQIDVRTGQPYPAYKASGVEWLGYVPMHWQSRRLKTLCDMQSGDAITAMSIEETGQYPVFGGNGIRGFSSNYTHDGDFVLIGRQGALCGNVHVVRGRFWASEHAIVATLRRYHIHEWLGALLEFMNLNQYSIAAAQPGLSIDRILNLQAPVPPTSEQRAISRHLGAMTAAIQEAVTATGHEIELVNEYRTRLIADVVTGKLDVREAAVGLPDVDRRGAEDDPDDGFNDEAGSEAAVWRHGVDQGSSLVAISDAERSEMAAGELMTDGKPNE